MESRGITISEKDYRALIIWKWITCLLIIGASIVQLLAFWGVLPMFAYLAYSLPMFNIAAAVGLLILRIRK